MATQAGLDDVMDELKLRGFKPKHEECLVSVEPDTPLGSVRTYVIEPHPEGFEVTLTEVEFDSNGDDNEEQSILGSYSTAKEVAEAIHEYEMDA